MKKRMLITLVILLLTTCMPAQAVQAKALYEYHTYVVDEDNKVLLTVYDYEETIMIDVKDLVALTGYELREEQDGFTFTKDAKAVVIKDQTIQCGPSKQTIKVVKRQDTTYVSLVPTIDYFQARIQFVDQHFILKKGKRSFYDVVKEMNVNLDQGYALLSNKAKVDKEVASLWHLFAANKVDTLPDRIKESVFTTLMFEFELDKQKLSSLIHEADLAFYAQEDESARIKHFQEVYGNRIDAYIKEDEMDLEIQKALTYYETITRYYQKNMNFTLQAVEIIYGKKSREYQMVDELIQLLVNNEKNRKALEVFVDEKMYDDQDKLADYILRANSLFSQAIKASSYYASKVNFYHASDIQSYKQAYLGLQAKTIEQMSKMHEKMQYQPLTKDEMMQYVKQARLYYHVAIAYSKFIEVPLGKKEEDSIARIRTHMYQFDAMIEQESLYYDDLTLHPSTLDYNVLKDGFVEPVDEKDIHLYDVYWVSDSLTPTFYKFLPNGKYDVYSGIFSQPYSYSGHYQLQGATLYLDGICMPFMNVKDARVDQKVIKNMDYDKSDCFFYESGWTSDNNHRSSPMFLMKSVKQPDITQANASSTVYEYRNEDFLVKCIKKSGIFNTKITLSFQDGYGNGEYQKELSFTYSNKEDIYEVKEEGSNTTYYIECVFDDEQVHLRLASDDSLDDHLAPMKEGIILTRVREG